MTGCVAIAKFDFISCADAFEMLLLAIATVELPVDRRQVAAHGTFADEESPVDLLVAQAFAYQRDDLTLANCEARGRLPSGWATGIIESAAAALSASLTTRRPRARSRIKRMPLLTILWSSLSRSLMCGFGNVGDIVLRHERITVS